MIFSLGLFFTGCSVHHYHHMVPSKHGMHEMHQGKHHKGKHHGMHGYHQKHGQKHHGYHASCGLPEGHPPIEEAKTPATKTPATKTPEAAKTPAATAQPQ